MSFIKGDALMLFMGGDALAYAKNHTLTITGNTIDISSKDHGYWGASEIGNLTWEVQTENLYTEDNYDKLFDAMTTKTPVDIVFAYTYIISFSFILYSFVQICTPLGLSISVISS